MPRFESKPSRRSARCTFALAILIVWLGSPPVVSRGTGQLAVATEPMVEPVPSNRAGQQALETLDTELQHAMERGLSPGLAVALVGRNGAIWARGYGLADVETQRAVTPDTPFMLASVSKTWIATALMREVDLGRLTLDRPINWLLPFPVDNPRIRGEIIRVHHLATHTSGIEDNDKVYEASYTPGDPTIEMDDWIRSYLTRGDRLYSKRRNFAARMPGQAYSYSNVAAALGAVVVEQTSGEPYRDYLRKHFFEPLGMHNTAFDLAAFPENTVAMPYDFEDGRFVEHGHYGLPTYADGQLRSSVHDLARYLAMLMNDGTRDGRRYLTSESVAQMEAEHHPDRGDAGQTTQALYWHRRFNGTMLGHSGGDYGMLTFIFYDLRHDLGGIVLMNSASEGAGELMGIALQGLTDASKSFR